MNYGERLATFPDFVMRIFAGTGVVHVKPKRTWVIIHGGSAFTIKDDDYDALLSIVERVLCEYVEDRGLHSPFSIEDLLGIRAYAARCVADEERGALKILFIVDDSLASIRRFAIPARALTANRTPGGGKRIVADCSCTLDPLVAMQYDMIIVRETTPSDYVTLMRIKKAGKVVMYDVDEYLFDLPRYHPKRITFTPLDKEIHYQLIEDASAVSVRSVEVSNHLKVNNPIILPDMVDTSLIVPVSPAQKSATFEVLCVTDETEQEDVDILDHVFVDILQDIPDSHITVIGKLPYGLQDSNGLLFDELKSRITWEPFPQYSEQYYDHLSRLSADVVLVPAATYTYNRWKSPVRIMEFLAKGVRVVYGFVSLPSDIKSTFPSIHEVNSPEGWITTVESIRAIRDTDRQSWIQGSLSMSAYTRAVLDAAVVAEMWRERLEWAYLSATTSVREESDGNDVLSHKMSLPSCITQSWKRFVDFIK